MMLRRRMPMAQPAIDVETLVVRTAMPDLGAHGAHLARVQPGVK
jgi:hypothetical protein